MSKLPPDLPVKQRAPMTVPQFMAAKERGQKLVVLTAYDYPTARLLDENGVDCILVGDSLGMVIQGNPNCLPVTLEEMIYHTRCVSQGVKQSLLVTDMPFLSFQVSPRQAVKNAGRLLKEGQAHAVKLEGGERSADTIAAIVRADIPVMAHVGMTPQSVHQFGGFKVQRQEERLLADAIAVEQAGAFSVVLECIPAEIARKITEKLKIPTIGIGAGVGCDGQVLVLHDMLGLLRDFQPRFAKRYVDLGAAITQAVEQYGNEVREGKFPGPEHEFR
jgi:3-methyl-2-oxobutanoate hydroxymethyltransferase